MLELKCVTKVYPAGGDYVRALKGVSLQFRNNELVSILGPSGCGKTTMLNIIGGLDHYSDGDLVINGTSTKEYSDRDWDSYRNHTIGFVFQSYNLIPHQTVLQNVELALTLSGVSKSERKRRAVEALQSVGLGSQLRKRPAEMSGGQMQRVAIARAIVNNPDIILADEPTGALDSETSVQVMDILKEIAKDRLVIMVTHNPDLAERYSTRIIRMLDGNAIGDTDPITPEELAVLQAEDEEKKKKKLADGKKDRKASMSLLTAFSLSLKNLFTKKGRTMLTSFAGSIGIIGIALITAVSQGTSDYIDQVQEDTLSTYPLTFMRESGDMSAILSGAMNSMQSAADVEEGYVQETQYMQSFFGGVTTNDLLSFKAHIDENYAEISEDINAIQYSYGITPQIYTRDVNGKILQANPTSFLSAMMGGAPSFMSSYYNMSVFNEMMDNPDLLKAQYEVLAGTWPENYDEMLLVLSDRNQINDILTYAVGLHDPEELQEMVDTIMSGGTVDVSGNRRTWSYNEFLDLQFRLVDRSDLYRYNSTYDLYEDMSKDTAYMESVYESSTPLRISGIVCAKAGVSATALSPGINYLPALTDYVMEAAAESEIVQKQKDDPDTNVFSGKKFGEEDQKGLDFSDLITVDEDAVSDLFSFDTGKLTDSFSLSGIDPSSMPSMDTSALTQSMTAMLANAIQNVDIQNVDTEAAQADFNETFRALADEMLRIYISENGDGNGTATIAMNQASEVADAYMATDSAKAKVQALAAKYGVDAETYEKAYSSLLSAFLMNYILETNVDLPSSDTVLPVSPAPTETYELPAEESEAASEESTGIALPTLPSDVTLPTLPSDVTLPTLPSDVTLPTDVTLPSDITLPTGDASQAVDEIIRDVMESGADISEDGIAGAIDSFENGIIYPSVAQTAAAQLMTPTLMNQAIASLTSQAAGAFQGIIAGYMNQLMASVSDSMSTAIQDAFSEMGESMSLDPEELQNLFQMNMSEEDMTRLMTSIYSGSSTESADSNLLGLGYAEADKPIQIAVYLKDFESKEHFIQFVSDYNEDMEDEDESKVISYTDITGVLMSSVTTIINAITYVLIAFVAISLIVSSIMIGVITLISVQERTKEIGILRAIGASKRNVSSMFNAETVIIGFTSGLLGVVITYLLTIPINIILHKLTGIATLSAKLPPLVAVILVIISMTLTLIAGIIPSGSAAKKDPVEALRSE